MKSSAQRRLAASIAASGALLAVTVVGALVARSLALLADAGHVLTDVAALTLSYIAARFAARSASPRHTFGLYRAEILAAFINAQGLLLVSAALLFESYRRLRTPLAIAPIPMLGFGLVSLAGNLFAVRFLHEHRHDNLNMRGAYLEVAFDALASGSVVAAAAAIALTRQAWIDPVISAVIAVLIIPRTVSLLRQSAHILLEGAPAEIDQQDLIDLVEAVPGVCSVHDLHVWTLTSGVHSASLHVTILPDADPSSTLRQVEECLREEKKIDHSTIQLEARRTEECAVSPRH